MLPTPFPPELQHSESDVEQLSIGNGGNDGWHEQESTINPVFYRNRRRWVQIMYVAVLIVFLVCLFGLMNVDVPMQRAQSHVSVQESVPEKVCLEYDESVMQTVQPNNCNRGHGDMMCTSKLPKDVCSSSFLLHKSQQNRTYNSEQLQEHIAQMMLKPNSFVRNLDSERDEQELDTGGIVRSRDAGDTDEQAEEVAFEEFMKTRKDTRKCNGAGCCPSYHSCRNHCLDSDASVLQQNTIVLQPNTRDSLSVPHPAVWIDGLLQYHGNVRSLQSKLDKLEISFNYNTTKSSMKISKKGDSQCSLQKYISDCLGSIVRISVAGMSDNNNVKSVSTATNGILLRNTHIILDYKKGVLYQEYAVADSSGAAKLLVPVWIGKETSSCLDHGQFCSRLCSIRPDNQVARTQVDHGYSHCLQSKHTWPVTNQLHRTMVIAGAPGLSCDEACRLSPVEHSCAVSHTSVPAQWKELAFGTSLITPIADQPQKQVLAKPLNFLCKDAFLPLIDSCPVLKHMYPCSKCTPAHSLELPGIIASNPTSNWGSISSKKHPILPGHCHTNRETIYSCNFKQPRISRMCLCVEKSLFTS